MPGIQLDYRFNPGQGREGPGDEPLAFGADRPDWYPIEILESAQSLICIEGHVYGGGRNSLIHKLKELAREALDSDDAWGTRLRSFAYAVDGDFVIVWYDRIHKRLCVTGDHFGRLPVYYHKSGERVVIARDQGYVLASIPDPSVDPLGLAQLLTFGYPLQSRTVIGDVHRLLPGEVLVASPSGCRVTRPMGSPFAITVPDKMPTTVKGCVGVLGDVFTTACRDRHVDEHHDVLSLSGGMDSRTVGAGMRSALDSFSSITFAAPGSVHEDERECGKDVATVLGSNWQGYEFNPWDRRDMYEIVRLKLGLSPVDLAFGLELVRRTRNDYPQPVSFWTGEGGDKLFNDHRAIPRSPGADELVHFIIEKNSAWSPEDVAELTGVSADSIMESVHAAVGAHNVAADDAYLHFLLAERVVRWHFEGEDRHRTETWPIAPFYAREVMALARAVPRRLKSGRRLYRAFLKTLAPDIANIPLPGGRAAPASIRYAVTHTLRDRLRNNRMALNAYQRRNRRRVDPSRDEWWRDELSRYQKDQRVPAPFDPAAIARVASGPTRHAANALPLLLTAMWAVNAICERAQQQSLDRA
jgi:asparagine synthase (glutamine-hydrolysing)